MTNPPVPEFVDSTDGVRVRIHDLGGDGPPLVLSHATGFCGGVWRPFAAALADRYHCYALDYRAHGETVTPPGTSLAWTGMGNDLLAVIDAVSPDAPVRVVGHSLGGAAIVLAGVAAPGRISAAAAFEPILFPLDTPPRDSPLIEGARRRRAVWPSRADVLERYGSRPPLAVLDPDALAAYVEHGFADLPDGTVALRCEPEHEAQVFEAHRSGAYEAAVDLAFPYLLAVGKGEDLPAVAGRRVATQHPERFTLAEYPDLTHFGPLQAPARLADDIDAWFGSLSS